MASKLPSALILIASLGLAACGLEKPLPGESHADEPRARVDARALPRQAQWLFTRPLKGISSAEHFLIEARFLEPRASVTLHAHFNGFRWRDGVQVRISRDEEGHVHLGIATPEFAFRETELPADFISASGVLRARLEIHDGVASGARVLAWNDRVSLQGRRERPRPFVLEGDADFDSQRERWTFLTQGRGARWGVEVEGAELDHAHREAPYVD